MASSSSSAMKGAYWPSWVNNFPPANINTSLFTHIYYAFLIPENVTFQFEINDATAALLESFTSTLRSMKPPVKTLLAIGGANAGSVIFSKMASSSLSRQNFIDSAVDVARKFGFDGIDLDWEFPENPTDMENLGILLGEWRATITTEASRTGRLPLLLSAATYFSVDFPWGEERMFPVASITANLDWINAMCYDYHGTWDTSMTRAHAALHDPTNNRISTNYGLQSWIQAGLPKKKLIMGLPLYGRTWTLRDPAVNGVRAPAVAVGPGNEGVMPYSEVVVFNTEAEVIAAYDDATVSAYSVRGTDWVGYDNGRSTEVKVRYARDLQIGGYFFWSVNQDHEWEISRRASEEWM